MSRTIFEIDADILSCIDTETGEILDLNKLEELNMERNKKIENVALYIKQLYGEAELIRAEEKALAERRKKKEKRAEGFASWLKQTLNSAEFETAKVAVSFRKSTVCEITGDAIEIIEALEKNGYDDCVKYGAPELKKESIKKLLCQGVFIPGAELVEKQNMQIK